MIYLQFFFIANSSDSRDMIAKAKHKVKLKKDDMLYIYSDGYQDQFGGKKGKKYMAAKFKKQLSKMSKEKEDQQLVMLDQEFSSWINDYEQIDDVCVMGVRII